MKVTPPTPPPKPSLHLNLDDWLPLLENDDVSQVQKIELIETLWSIMLTFADFGWEFDTTEETSGQCFDLTTTLRQAVLSSQDTPDKESEDV